MYRNYFLLFCLTSSVYAAQDDVLGSLRSPYALFGGNEEEKTKFLSDFTFRGGFGTYMMGDGHHSWQFKSHGDIALISFGKTGLWRMGVGLDGIADSENSIGFRIAQNHYEYFTALEGIAGPGVAYGGYRHRCKHLADNTVGRIVMRSGPEFGYKSLFNLPFGDLIWESTVLLVLAGQNEDITFHPRAFFSNAIQLEYKVWPSMKLFSTVGFGVVVATQSKASDVGKCEREGSPNGCGSYSMFTGADHIYAAFTPAGAFGLSFVGNYGEFRIYNGIHYNFDTGFTKATSKALLLSLMAEFVM
jgi:hypothetical protein